MKSDPSVFRLLSPKLFIRTGANRRSDFLLRLKRRIPVSSLSTPGMYSRSGTEKLADFMICTDKC